MSKKEDIAVDDLRINLKKAFKNELKELPKLLQKLEPKDRLNFLCKMMPYVFPKLENVHFKEGETFNF